MTFGINFEVKLVATFLKASSKTTHKKNQTKNHHTFLTVWVSAAHIKT